MHGTISQAQLSNTHTHTHIYIYIFHFQFMFNDALYLSIEKEDNRDNNLEEKRKEINMTQLVSLSLNFLGVIVRNFNRPTVP